MSIRKFPLLEKLSLRLDLGSVSWRVLSVIFSDNCYKLLKSMHLIGWEQLCQWKSLTRLFMKCSPVLTDKLHTCNPTEWRLTFCLLDNSTGWSKIVNVSNQLLKIGRFFMKNYTRLSTFVFITFFVMIPHQTNGLLILERKKFGREKGPYCWRWLVSIVLLFSLPNRPCPSTASLALTIKLDHKTGVKGYSFLFKFHFQLYCQSNVNNQVKLAHKTGVRGYFF